MITIDDNLVSFIEDKFSPEAYLELLDSDTDSPLMMWGAEESYNGVSVAINKKFAKAVIKFLQDNMERIPE